MDIQSIINSMLKVISDAHDLLKNDSQPIPGEAATSSNSKENRIQNIRYSNIVKITEEMNILKLYILRKTHKSGTADAVLSVPQCLSISKCVDFLVITGIVPCLLPNILDSFENIQKKSFPYSVFISPIENYEELKYLVDLLFDLVEVPTLNRIVMGKHTNVLLAGLCQLCLLPIAKPGTPIAIKNSIDESKYEELKNEQKMFKAILVQLILKERNPLVIQELLFVLGNKNCNTHLKVGLGELVSELLLQPKGIKTFLKVACDLIGDKSQSFCQQGLHEWSKLIHNYYKRSKSKYIQYIKPQIWKLLRSNKKSYQIQFRSIAVHCISLISTDNYNDFLTLYINPIHDSTKQCKLTKEKTVSVSQCIEDLHTLFYLFKNESWSLNPKLLTHFSATIYNIYTATVRSVYYLKPKLEDLVYMILVNFSNCKDHLKLIVFSKYQIDIEYDGETIKVEYTERENQLHLEHEIDWVINLIDKRKDKELFKSMFMTFLDMYTHISTNEYSVMEKLFIVKGIHHLIENKDVQKSLASESDLILNLVKSILKENTERNTVDVQIISIVLMVLECALDNVTGQYKKELSCFVTYLQQIFDSVEDDMFKMMVLDIQKKIKLIQNNSLKNPILKKRTIVNVLTDARNPSIPCRSHALIELKKMINSGDKTVLTKKTEILIMIQENLKHPDSYLYMSAIFTLSSFCSQFPSEILPILCEQYSMPKNYNHSPETRLKIGEALMKTVKMLNEIVPSYRNTVLNALMTGVRDNDNLVRASSLSNMAELCKLLRYGLGPIISEVVNCADCVLRYDAATEPRRAAALLLRMIIEGGGSKILDILADGLQDIYRMLKYYYQSDADSTVQLHSQIAIEKLNETMKSLFLTHQNITGNRFTIKEPTND